jgi:uncharacterized phage protein gp47/JayE
LRFQGSATIEAIRADVLSVDDVEQVFVYENVGLITDGRNLPPKSIEVIAQGGTDADVAEAIFDSKAAGIESYGHAPNDVTEIVTDSQGIDHTINFTRPTEVAIYIDLELDYDPSIYNPATDDDLVKAALKALGDSLILSQTVIYERFQAEVFSIPGVVDCQVFKLDDIFPPVGTSNVLLTERELAVFATAAITVASSSI